MKDVQRELLYLSEHSRLAPKTQGMVAFKPIFIGKCPRCARSDLLWLGCFESDYSKYYECQGCKHRFETDTIDGQEFLIRP